MAGKKDEIVGVDNLTDKLTEPSQKKTYQDLWNAAYRGLVPGGLNANDGPVPALPEGGDGGPEPFDETEQYVTEPEVPEQVKAQPVVVIDNLSRVQGSVEQYFHAYQVNVGPIETVRAVNRDPRRIRVIFRNWGAGESAGVYIGETESVGLTGYLLAVGQTLTLETTREVWLIREGGLATEVSPIHVLVEYEKEI